MHRTYSTQGFLDMQLSEQRETQTSILRATPSRISALEPHSHRSVVHRCPSSPTRHSMDKRNKNSRCLIFVARSKFWNIDESHPRSVLRESDRDFLCRLRPLRSDNSTLAGTNPRTIHVQLIYPPPAHHSQPSSSSNSARKHAEIRAGGHEGAKSSDALRGKETALLIVDRITYLIRLHRSSTSKRSVLEVLCITYSSHAASMSNVSGSGVSPIAAMVR
ncbi:hypothetical protein FPV67DRAFT_308697 [Lyophyllum atratum]|nr:hypothetical protein FPV67DRAFT_308697 [Lyophyllum atratum]